MVEVDMGDDDRGQVCWPDTERGKRVPDNRRGRSGACLDQARPVAADKVACGNAVVAGHPGVDLVQLVPEIGDGIIDGGSGRGVVHAHIMSAVPPRVHWETPTMQGGQGRELQVAPRWFEVTEV